MKNLKMNNEKNEKMKNENEKKKMMNKGREKTLMIWGWHMCIVDRTSPGGCYALLALV